MDFKLLIKTSRPASWVLPPLIFLMGIIYSGATVNIISVIQIVLLSFPLCLLVYGINDVYDYESDQLNPRKKLIEGIKLEKKDHSFVKKASLIVIILLIVISLLTLNGTNILFTFILVFLSYFYSAPPLRLKEKPPLDSISNGLIVLLVFMLGFSYNKTFFDITKQVCFCALCVSAVHAFSTISDIIPDKQAKNKTFAIVFGEKPTIIFSLIIFILAFIFSGIETIAIRYYFLFCAVLLVINLIFSSRKLSILLFRLMFIGAIVTAFLYIIS
ncbi:MAG: UbiA family prenyltransferase [Candidatus Nanoarchaeia archaeon]|nr:UbiA family prenyltransferase [Candidatus Nanoarchaeia archaeon]